MLFHLGPFGVPTHDFFVGLGVTAALTVFLLQLRGRGYYDERIWGVVAGALAGGALLSRLGTWAQHFSPSANAGFLEQWAYGSRSILSGLVGAYVGALIAKRVTGLKVSTGDLFAAPVALGMAIGRVGCLLTELPGTPTGLPFGVTLSTADAALVPRSVAGVPLHPSFAYEILFHLAAFVLLLRYRNRFAAPGALFAGYLLAYAGFRFLVEFVRGNEVVAVGLTRPQWFLLACAPLAVWAAVRRTRRGGFALAAS
ncbi:MAG: diacylglyceryl transferase [Hamadaea sp.]|nr:diacylglyceryl transferase [Hamadaea sp.]